MGSAGSTGRGEANLFNLSSFLIIEQMRRGLHPKDACLKALRRITANTIEKRLLDSRGRPNFGMDFYALNAKGEHGGAGFYPSRYAICTENGPQIVTSASLYEGRPAD